MADDINKKITIEVELEADKLTEDITNLNKTIDSLLAKQRQLNAAGQQNSAAFESISSKLDDLQKKLKDATTQVTANSTALNALSISGKTAETSLSALTTQHQKNAKAAEDSSAKTKELSGQVNALGQAVNQQKSSTDQSKSALDGYAGSIAKGVENAQQLESNLNGANNVLSAQARILNGNKTAFDAHKVTMEHLKTSFDEIKNVSGIFGPSLKEAAQGFGAMKSGLKLVQDGLTGVGTAIRADGFEFLLQILQLMFDYFVKSANGSRILKGAISAIGVVVNQVKEYFHLFVDGIVNAFSHPIETLKSLGKTIEQNLINRFKAFGVILDGIIHLAHYFLKNDRQANYQIDQQKIERNEKYDGFLAIATNVKGIDTALILDHYKHLYQVEHAFRTFKSYLETRPMFHWTDQRIKGHLCLCYIAYTIQIFISNQLKKNRTPLTENNIRSTLDKMQLSLIEQGGEQYYLRSKQSPQALIWSRRWL